MKRVALFALVAALVVALTSGVAVAKPGKAKGPKKEKTVTYVFHGIVSSVSTTTTDPLTGESLGSDAVTVSVERGNKAARSYSGQDVTFAVDSGTNVQRNDEEAALSDIQPGDTVKVQVKAPSSETSFTARQVLAEGPESQPETETEIESGEAVS